MVLYNDSTCPKCGGCLQYYNTISRILKIKGGGKTQIKMRRMICRQCTSIHRELPEGLLPYKHYSSEIILGVLNNEITSDDLAFEDYPCEMTMNRWKKTLIIAEIAHPLMKQEVDAMRKKGKIGVCPDCGGITKYYDQVSRTIRTGYGNKERIKIARFKCVNCGKIHRILPSHVMKNKQFTKDVIHGFVESSLSTDELRFENFPSDATIRRWKKEHGKQ